MKNRIFIAILLLSLFSPTWAQIGGDYDPNNPDDPGTPVLKYNLSLIAEPANSGSFNISNERIAVGSNNSLYAYTNTDYVFKHWMIGDSILSTNSNLDFVMPSHNVQIVGVFEYDPTNPANPNANFWNIETGEVIVDDFTPGSLQYAVRNVIGNSNVSDVTMITVAGVMNNNDFGIANNYTNCSLLDLCRVTGITEIPSYAFDYTNLESVYLPSTIEKIGYWAFADCSKLSSVIIYAMTPPTLGSGVFQGVPEGLVVYVPAAAIAQYQDDETWGKYTLLPIQEDIRNISVSLPNGTNVQDYAQMWLELTNTKNGQRIHYVMTDRTQYTFPNIICNTSWNVVLRNERGDVFGQIDNVEVKDDDVAVTFASLSKPQNVILSVLTPEGKNVTEQVQVTWTDASGNYLAQSASLSGLPVGFKANYRVVLSQELAMMYNTPQIVEYTLKNDGNNLKCQLEAIKQVQLSGKVKDATTGLPLSGAVISASQTFGGKYSKTQNVKTDKNGVFTITVSDVATSLAFAASDYISMTMICDSLMKGDATVTLPDVSLNPITGATITIGLTYTNVEGETQEWYSDYQNVNYELFNVTKNSAIKQYNVQYPQIVLLEDVDDGDVLKLIASSRTNAFKPVESNVTIAGQKADATFAIIELGQIQASFEKNGNASVVGSLYDASGKLLKAYNYSNASLVISDLADGQYSLVSMGSSQLYNTIYDLSQLPQTGLVEGSDYVKNTVEVKSGAISQIIIEEVPTLDESKLYYTGNNTSFTVNKPSIVVGNYLTLTGHIDFKPAYATNVSNVQMIVDLPESCQFVENSVMVGNSTSSYTHNGQQITIPMTRYTDRVRFCIIPTLGGEYAPSALVQFDLDGEIITQPIGSANYTAKDLSISVPSTVAKTCVPVSGTAIGTSNVEIYDNGVLIGQTTSLANGTWATTCELNEPYNMSRHQIYAKITTMQGLSLGTERNDVVYNKYMIKVSRVTMLNTAHGPSSLDLLEYRTVFDFLNPTFSSKTYWYWPSYPTFTFLIDFTNNSEVSNVDLHVKTSNNSIVKIPATYDKEKDMWIVVSDKFDSSSLPKNVSVTYDYLDTSVVMDSESYVGYSFSELSNCYVKSFNRIDNVSTFEIVDAVTLDTIYNCYKEFPLTELEDISKSIDILCYDTIFHNLNYSLFRGDNNTIILLQTYNDSIIVFVQSHQLQDDFLSLVNDNSTRRRINPRSTDGVIYPEYFLDRLRDNRIRAILDIADRKLRCKNTSYEDKEYIADAVMHLRDLVVYLDASFFANVASVLNNFTRPQNSVDVSLSVIGAGNTVNFGNDVPRLNHAILENIDIIRRLGDDCRCDNSNNRRIAGKRNYAAGNSGNCRNGDCGDDSGDSGDGDGGYVMDPSGYVYEGVASNRVQGATATVFYKEMVEDMYGDLHENIVKWDAEEYAQDNPLFTDEYGMYQWDVPQGLWQVKFEKEGYETAYSEWLPVPPPQLDVNIGMKQNVQPNVKTAHAYEEAVEIEFDKYMMPEDLNDYNISVIQNGNPVEGTISLLNEETSYTNNEETFASKVRFNAAQPFTAQEVTLMVSNRVKSYAGIRMQDDFSQTFSIEQEIKQIVCDSLKVVPYGEKTTLTVSVLPASASKGKTLIVKTSSTMILGVETEQVSIGEDGKAEIIVSGDLPGSTALTFSVEGTDRTAITIANVKTIDYTIVAAPIASIASGTVVDMGTQITLSCETEGVTIYYTIDGSCPCDNASRIKYDGTPIVINEGVTIKVIAVAPNGTESEVAEYVYTVPDDEDEIIQVPATFITNSKDAYDISGRKVERKTKGIIIRNNNGTNRKVLVK